jgi:hypothetical protein
MAKLKELTVWIENKPGTPPAIAETLCEAKRNLAFKMIDDSSN